MQEVATPSTVGDPTVVNARNIVAENLQHVLGQQKVYFLNIIIFQIFT